MMDLARLFDPFDPSKVSWRVGSTTKDKDKGMALAYIDARDVMERLDEVCSPAGWQARYPHANDKTVCEIGIKVGDEWIWKANGAGDSDVEAEKGACSDAFKRAAVLWGIGRYLYDCGSPWVELEARGRSYVIKAGQEGKLRAALNGAASQIASPSPGSKPESAPPRPATNGNALSDRAKASPATPKVASGSPTKPDAVEATLIAAISLAETVADLTDWASDPANVAAVKTLDAAAKDRVRGHWSNVRTSLLPPPPKEAEPNLLMAG